MAERTWIRFEDGGASASGKTRIWLVEAKEDGAALGEVRWYAPWRKYSFLPASMTVFEKDCLRMIADFCEAQTLQHRRAKTSAG